MVANATIDLISYVNNTDSNSKSNGRANDSGADFNNVFKTVNKTYKSDETKTYRDDRVKEEKTDTDFNAKEETKNTAEKADAQYSSSNNSETQKATIKTDSNSENKQVGESSKEDETKADTNIKETASTTTENVVAETSVQVDPIVVIVQATPDVTLQNDIEAPQAIDEKQLAEETKDNKKTELSDKKETNTPVAVAQPQILDNAQIINQSIVLTNEAIDGLKETVNVPQEVNINTNVEDKIKKATSINNIGLESSKLTDLKIDTQISNVAQIEQTPMQAQSAEISATNQVKISSKTPETKAQNETNTTKTNQTAMPQTDIIETKMPVLQANTEIVASNLTTKTVNLKQSETEIVDNGKLSQEMINKTNAKVVSVEQGSNNSGSNLMNKQSPQEQGVRLAIENNSKPIGKGTAENIDLTKMGDAGQITFAKTLDNIQTTAPKELSKTDIMSQINNQLSTLKEETNSKITIILRPENLGKISIELTNGKDGLIARMTTDNAQVKELLDKHIDSLKDTLGNQGVNVNNVTVKVSETQKQDNMFSFSEQKGQGNQQTPENKQTNAQNRNEGNGLPMEEEIDTSTESIETESRVETSISMSSRLGKIDYKI